MPITLQSRRLRDALQKATQVGRVEDPVTIAGCSIVLQNLTPDDYVAISDELEEVAEARVPFFYQLAHVARSIVEINGEDLRDVAYIEDEVPAGSCVVTITTKSESAAQKLVEKLKADKIHAVIEPPPEDGQVRTVKVERHEWISNNVLSTWPKESLSVAWRKLTELLVVADAKAKEGVKFQSPDETAEEKLRRLLNDLQETWEELPTELADRLLSESGLLRKSSLEELEAVEERLSTMKAKPSEPVAPPPAPAPRPAPPPAAAVVEEETPQPRRPLNQQYTDIPQAIPREQVPVRTRAPVPEQLRQAAIQNTQRVNVSMLEEAARTAPQPTSRAQQIAAIEAMDPEQELLIQSRPAPEVVGEYRSEPPVDGRAFAALVEKPPVVGLNPKFRPRT